jgi:hypothetical protein
MAKRGAGGLAPSSSALKRSFVSNDSPVSTPPFDTSAAHLFGTMWKKRGETPPCLGGEVPMLPRWVRRVIISALLTEVIRFLFRLIHS